MSSDPRSYKTQVEADLNSAIEVIYKIKNIRENSGLKGVVGVLSALFGQESSAVERKFYEKKLPEDSLRSSLSYEKKARILQDFLLVISWARVNGRQEGEFFSALRSLLSGYPASVQALFTGVGNSVKADKVMSAPDEGTELTSIRVKAVAPSAPLRSESPFSASDSAGEDEEKSFPEKFRRVFEGGHSPVPAKSATQQADVFVEIKGLDDLVVGEPGVPAARRGSTDASDGLDSPLPSPFHVSDATIYASLVSDPPGKAKAKTQRFEIDNSGVKPPPKPFDPDRGPWT
jgi:hypothetical protein